MSARATHAIGKTLRVVALVLGFATVLTLTVVSVEQVAQVVILPLLLSEDIPRIVLLGTILAALIPFGYMVVSAGIFFRNVVTKLFR